MKPMDANTQKLSLPPMEYKLSTNANPHICGVYVKQEGIESFNPSLPFNRITIFGTNLEVVFLTFKTKHPKELIESIYDQSSKNANEYNAVVKPNDSKSLMLVLYPLKTIQIRKKNDHRVYTINTQKPTSILSYLLTETDKTQNSEDLLAVNVLKSALESEKIEFIQLSQFLIEIHIPSRRERLSCYVKVQIKKQVLKIMYQGPSFDNLPEYNLKALDHLLMKMNSDLKFGVFIKRNNILFITSYSIAGNFKLIAETYSEIDKIYGKVQSMIRAIELVLTSRFFTIEDHQYKQELEIKSRLDFYKSNNFFINRFNNKLTLLKEGPPASVRYVTNPNVESFQACIEDSVSDIHSFITDMISQLSEINLYFKHDKFPLEDFGLANERLIFLHKTLLSNVLEAEPKDFPEESQKMRVKNAKANLYDIAVNYHKNNLFRNRRGKCDSEELNKNLQKFSKFGGGRMNCAESYRLSLNNPCPYVVRFHGFGEFEGENVLFHSLRVKGCILGELENVKIMKLKSIILKVVQMVEGVLVRNSSIRCFDLGCVLVEEEGSMVLVPKAQEDVDQDFWAPEVAKGRATSKSLIYSLGTAIKYIISSQEHRFLGDWKNCTEIPTGMIHLIPKISEIITASCEKSLVRRASIAQIRDMIGFA